MGQFHIENNFASSDKITKAFIYLLSNFTSSRGAADMPAHLKNDVCKNSMLYDFL